VALGGQRRDLGFQSGGRCHDQMYAVVDGTPTEIRTSATHRRDSVFSRLALKWLAVGVGQLPLITATHYRHSHTYPSMLPYISPL
jgi:hypothetical protein